MMEFRLYEQQQRLIHQQLPILYFDSEYKLYGSWLIFNPRQPIIYFDTESALSGHVLLNNPQLENKNCVCVWVCVFVSEREGERESESYTVWLCIDNQSMLYDIVVCKFQNLIVIK